MDWACGSDGHVTSRLFLGGVNDRLELHCQSHVALEFDLSRHECLSIQQMHMSSTPVCAGIGGEAFFDAFGCAFQTCWGLSLPSARATKSASEMVMVQLAFLALPCSTLPVPFLRSTIQLSVGQSMEVSCANKPAILGAFVSEKTERAHPHMELTKHARNTSAYHVLPPLMMNW